MFTNSWGDPTDHVFWEFFALSAGTSGSAIIIGSAAGVAVMGIEKINFFWYLTNVSWLALAGFLAGLATLYFAAIDNRLNLETNLKIS